MPTYHCTQCGAPVETGDSFAPTAATCPACRGEVPPAAHDLPPEIEQAAFQAPPPPPPVRQVAAPPLARPYQAPSQFPRPAAKRKSFAPWVLAATLIAGVIGGFGTISTVGEAAKNGGALATSLIGATLAVAAMGAVVGLIAALVMLLFGKPFGSSMARTYCVAVILIALISAFGSITGASLTRKREAQQAKAEKTRQTVEAMERDMDAMFAERQNADGTPKNIELRLESDAPKDDMEVARHLLQSVINDSATLQNEYLAALKKEGLFTLLEAERLAGDQEFKQSRTIIAACRKRVEEYREKAKKIAMSVPERLDRYELSAKAKRSFLSGYENEKARNTTNLDANWNLEAESIELTSKIIDHLEAKREAWVVEEGALAFHNDEDLEKYNAILKQIDDCSAKQTELQEKARDRFKAEMKELKEDSGK